MDATWYSVTIEASDDGEWWRERERRWTQVSDVTAETLADNVARDYDLAEEEHWRVRIYAGYNRFHDLVYELADAV